MRPTAYKADLLLLLAAAIWGSGFVAQRLGMDHVGPMTFNAVRFAIGFLTLLLVIRLRRPRGDNLASSWRACALGGGVAGVVLFVAAALQQIGMVTTTAGKGGFITGLYVVLVPVLGICVRVRAGYATWAGAALAIAGLYLLSVTASFELARGDWWVVASAFFWALHVLVIGRLAPRVEALRFAAVQLAIAFALALIAALLVERIRADEVAAAKWAIVYSGVFPVAVAFGLQVVAQRSAPPAHAAVLLSLEAVFAALCGWIILGETLAGRQLAGCALMLCGGLISQIRRRGPVVPVP